MSLTSRGRRRAAPRLAPARNETAPQDETPAQDKTAAQGKIPAQDKTAAQDATAAQDDTVPRDDTAPGDGHQSRPETPATDASPVAGDTPAAAEETPPPGDTGPAEQQARRRVRRGPLALAGRPAVVAVGIGLLLAGSGAVGLLLTRHTGHVPPHVARVKPVLPPVGPQQQTPAPEVAERVPPPVSLTIPVIGVRTQLIRLRLTPSGALQVPGSPAVAGWYTGSPPPGAVGSSVIAGHVDSYLGPGVFFRLRLLHRGDRIYVREAGGRVAVFVVSSVRLYKQTQFPRAFVYGPTPTPTLRLITCGGTFDYQTRGYLSNVVVFATLAS